MKLVFTSSARSDLARLQFFLREQSPIAAKNAASRIKKTSLLLLEQPRMGRPAFGPENYHDDIREIPIRFGGQGYLMRYQILGDVIRILRIWHFRESRL